MRRTAPYTRRRRRRGCGSCKIPRESTNQNLSQPCIVPRETRSDPRSTDPRGQSHRLCRPPRSVHANPTDKMQKHHRTPPPGHTTRKILGKPSGHCLQPMDSASRFYTSHRRSSYPSRYTQNQTSACTSDRHSTGRPQSSRHRHSHTARHPHGYHPHTPRRRSSKHQQSSHYPQGTLDSYCSSRSNGHTNTRHSSHTQTGNLRNLSEATSASNCSTSSHRHH